MEPKTKAEILLALLTAAGPAGVLNSDLPRHVGWAFPSVVRQLRNRGHKIETRRVGSGYPRAYKTILIDTAPLPELRPIMALLQEVTNVVV